MLTNWLNIQQQLKIVVAKTIVVILTHVNRTWSVVVGSSSTYSHQLSGERVGPDLPTNPSCFKDLFERSGWAMASNLQSASHYSQYHH